VWQPTCEFVWNAAECLAPFDRNNSSDDPYRKRMTVPTVAGVLVTWTLHICSREGCQYSFMARIEWLTTFVMLDWPCILNYMNNNQHDALFIFSVLNYHTSTRFGRIGSPSSGGRMYEGWSFNSGTDIFMSERVDLLVSWSCLLRSSVLLLVCTYSSGPATSESTSGSHFS
jgi:hypothetical protein